MPELDGEASQTFETPSLDQLLRISIELSDKEKLHEEALVDRKLEMSDEDKEFLRKAMGTRDDGTLKSDGDRIREALAGLAQPAATLERREYALDLLLFLAEDVDNACDLAKMDGGEAIAPLLAALDDEAPSLRMGAAWILGTMAQNNPPPQKALVAKGVLPKVLAMADDAAAPVVVRQRALLCVSSLARDGSAGEAAFADASGFGVLGRLLGADVDGGLRTRALFLLRHLAVSSEAMRAAALAAALVAPCSELVRTAGAFDCDAREKAAQALAALAGGVGGADADLVAAANERLRQIAAITDQDEREDCEEEARTLQFNI